MLLFTACVRVRLLLVGGLHHKEYSESGWQLYMYCMCVCVCVSWESFSQCACVGKDKYECQHDSACMCCVCARVFACFLKTKHVMAGLGGMAKGKKLPNGADFKSKNHLQPFKHRLVLKWCFETITLIFRGFQFRFQLHIWLWAFVFHFQCWVTAGWYLLPLFPSEQFHLKANYYRASKIWSQNDKEYFLLLPIVNKAIHKMVKSH